MQKDRVRETEREEKTKDFYVHTNILGLLKHRETQRDKESEQEEKMKDFCVHTNVPGLLKHRETQKE